jgi:hypothetical protein
VGRRDERLPLERVARAAVTDDLPGSRLADQGQDRVEVTGQVQAPEDRATMLAVGGEQPEPVDGAVMRRKSAIVAKYQRS